jgi:hypothetical protein
MLETLNLVLLIFGSIIIGIALGNYMRKRRKKYKTFGKSRLEQPVALNSMRATDT